MHTPPPPGLLLDVDGPLASPVTRSLSAPGLVADLVTLLAAGVPVVLNTGRSADFVAEQVVAPLLAAGLPAGARLHAVCEKGAVWATAGPGGLGPVHVDPGLAVPAVGTAVVTALLDGEYGGVGFLDRSKRSMVTVEARTDLEPGAFTVAQPFLCRDLLAGLREAGLGVRLDEADHPDAEGRVPWRIDPSVIATDVESTRTGKDLGARRALELLAADGDLPTRWHTMGDSATDYAMADQLHALGHDVVHVDVRPAGTPAERPYRVHTLPGLVDDAAGAAHLRTLVEQLT
ncbi:hypothetical protein GB931_17255 [Modestobacter sp. I12A-02628]|uniref:Hydroxymethylpyrimidine pyrophosphatase-like HAD family hydrolase n=1 Tax=Goekera deserti TaxID=2497753 RepID=A0A7K3WDZ5_9ACTN|nr:hypothetical protein [Goekera deserti]MPQ99633.1 hypothetical protein [Goekera deserti]NDI46357.1 hypothetical protein [Goekera deserti]NEL54711.1 hypothetical protein [Goekera deserti]